MEKVLNLEVVGPDLYENSFSDVVSSTRNTLFGGHTVSMAVKAALLTVPTDKNYVVNSVHSSFIRPAAPDSAVTYQVYNKRDGQIFCHRGVIARQNEKIVFTCSVSFQSPDDTEAAHLPYNYEEKPSVPGPSDPDCIFAIDKRLKLSYFTILGRNTQFPLAMKLCSPPKWIFKDQEHTVLTPITPRSRQWIKSKEQLQTRDQNIHRIALIYGSDVGMAGTIVKQYPYFSPSLVTSLNHCVWFQGDVDMNKWHLFDIKCLTANVGTNLSISRIYRENGTLVATAVQQGYIRGPKL